MTKPNRKFNVTVFTNTVAGGLGSVSFDTYTPYPTFHENGFTEYVETDMTLRYFAPGIIREIVAIPKQM